MIFFMKIMTKTGMSRLEKETNIADGDTFELQKKNREKKKGYLLAVLQKGSLLCDAILQKIQSENTQRKQAVRNL